MKPNTTKLDFLFYDFSVIYYFFKKASAEINKKKKEKGKTVPL